MENQSDYDVLLAEIAHLKMQKKSRGAKEIVQDEIIDQLKALLQSRQQQIESSPP